MEKNSTGNGGGKCPGHRDPRENPSPALRPVNRQPPTPGENSHPAQRLSPSREGETPPPPARPPGAGPALRPSVRSWGHLVASGADCFHVPLPPQALAVAWCPPVSVCASGSRAPPAARSALPELRFPSGFSGSRPASRGYVSFGCPPRVLGLQHLKYKPFDFYFFFNQTAWKRGALLVDITCRSHFTQPFIPRQKTKMSGSRAPGRQSAQKRHRPAETRESYP